MLTRRHLRIKALQVLYSYFIKDDNDLPIAEKELSTSVEKMYDMYLYLFTLMGEMQKFAIEKIEAGTNKKMPTAEDLHPNTKFVTNVHLRTISNSKILNEICEKKGINWNEHRQELKGIFKNLTETSDYQEYMASDQRGFDHDREYILRFFKRHIINEDFIAEFFEEESVFWNDDLDLMCGMVIKSLKLIDEVDTDVELLELWKDPEDEKNFLYTLFRQTIVQSLESEEVIAKFAKNWDKERIATMDMILMKMAIAEASSFPQIPLKVTLNEYIELSKYYSLPQSSGFINGVLDQAYGELVKTKKIKKIGRGLIQ